MSRMWTTPVLRIVGGTFVVAALFSVMGLSRVTTPDALGEIPRTEPVFTNPTNIDNGLFPVSPGAVKVFLGREEGRRVTVVVAHALTTRVFDWDGQSVRCRIVQEQKFVRGRLVEDEKKYYAQANDGSVYCFGETEVEQDGSDVGDDEDDADENDPGGWIVGFLGPNDPPKTFTGQAPALFMPANPVKGDTWRPENAPPYFIETATVRSANARVRVPTGRYQRALRVRSTEPDEAGREVSWFAHGIGLVKTTGPRERLRLNATSLRVR